MTAMSTSMATMLTLSLVFALLCSQRPKLAASAAACAEESKESVSLLPQRGGKIRAGGGGDAVKNCFPALGKGCGRPRLPPVRQIGSDDARI